MAVFFDRIVLAVPDLPPAIEQYRALLGPAPWTFETSRGEPAAWWGLSNTVIELVQRTVKLPRMLGIVFSSPEAAQGESAVANRLGIEIRMCDGTGTADFRRRRPEAIRAELAVDHVVLRTDAARACVDFFTGELGIRLALDKTVPAWGGRMLFFRAGKLTLEVVESGGEEPPGSVFWGLAYRGPDLAETVRELEGRAVALSGIRRGRKPGTLVATVKSHCLGIPTLLIQGAR